MTENILPRKRPKIVFIVDYMGWAGERLSLDLSAHLADTYDCSVVRLGNKEHLAFDADLYIYRNVCWLNIIKVPSEMYRRIVVLVESKRAFAGDNLRHFPEVLGVIPLNQQLEERVKLFNPRHVWTPIPNGVNTEEFTPASELPHEFVVGAAGNFLPKFYEQWKGFGSYIVPACKKAGVKLEWRSWKGLTSVPGMKQSKQENLRDMCKFYHGLSCFISMSKSEGCSGVIFEALACGVPVIATKVGWHGAQAGTGITWVERPGNETPENVKKAVDALACAILAQKRKNLRTPVTESRLFAEKYSWDKMAPLWKDAIAFYLATSVAERRTVCT